jgi:5-dehydro-2-deoxygluconokinase
MAIAPDDYSADFIGRARALLVSGSHLTTRHAKDNIAAAIARARERATRVIFDIDYRPLFWGLAQRDGGESRYVESSTVTAASQEFLHLCDLVVGTEEEIRIAGGSLDTLEALRGIRAKTAATLVLKRGPLGCVAFEGAIPARIDDGLVVPGFPVDVFNVVGAGDGFMGGLLFGWLRDRPLAEACRIGNACGALVVSRHGCSPASPTAGELAWFLQRGDGPVRPASRSRAHATASGDDAQGAPCAAADSRLRRRSGCGPSRCRR